MAYYTGVLRASSLTLLAACVLLAGTLHAQRGGGAGRGGSTFGGRSGFHQGHPGSRNFRNFRNNFSNNGAFYPYWDDGFWGDEPFWDDQTLQDQQPPPPAMMMPPPQFLGAPQTVHAANPKLIELPADANSAASKPLPSAVFILENGERLESRLYMLTHDNLYVTIDHHQRTIPFDKLNISATTAANRERGIDLRIPSDRNQISLSF